MAELEQYKELVKKTLIDLGCQTLVNVVEVKWNSRMRVMAGRANVYMRKSQMGYFITRNPSIELCRILFQHMTDGEKRKTVIHETCHVVAHIKYEELAHHGQIWKSLMRKCGYSPDVYHDMPVKQLGLTNRKRRYKAKCGCREHTITTTTKNRINRGCMYQCKVCKNKLELI